MCHVILVAWRTWTPWWALRPCQVRCALGLYGLSIRRAALAPKAQERPRGQLDGRRWTPLHYCFWSCCFLGSLLWHMLRMLNTAHDAVLRQRSLRREICGNLFVACPSPIIPLLLCRVIAIRRILMLCRLLQEAHLVEHQVRHCRSSALGLASQFIVRTS